ncbi:CD1375 family protein [Senegalia massiliensis]|nr:CD1375 family protein [Senegalia massiliensis]
MFSEDSEIVKSYALLIKNNRKTIDDVPDYKNLKEVVQNVLKA